MELAGQIRRRRKELGLSQEELAARIYVSRQTISNWETDRTYPDVQSLLLLSALFGTTVDELIKGDVEMMQETREQDAKRMNRLSWAACALTLAAIVVMVGGLVVWDWGGAPTLVSGLSLTALALMPAFEVEKLKKKHDVLTYGEIAAFEKGAEPDRSTAASLRIRRHPLRDAALKALAAGAVGALVAFVAVYLLYATGLA